jgi:4a-hydroxytetrahydrobiopterin dehydratase
MEQSMAAKRCTACVGGIAALQRDQIQALRAGLGEGWRVDDDLRLEREFRFKDFKGALAFTNAVGAVAEAENHHPDIYLSWGKVRATLWTHKAKGLTENDFILAAKIDALTKAD